MDEWQERFKGIHATARFDDDDDDDDDDSDEIIIIIIIIIIIVGITIKMKTIVRKPLMKKTIIQTY